MDLSNVVIVERNGLRVPAIEFVEAATTYRLVSNPHSDLQQTLEREFTDTEEKLVKRTPIKIWSFSSGTCEFEGLDVRVYQDGKISHGTLNDKLLSQLADLSHQLREKRNHINEMKEKVALYC